MTITKYGHVDVFKTGIFSNLLNLGQIGHCMPELQQLQQLQQFVKFTRPGNVKNCTTIVQDILRDALAIETFCHTHF